MPTQVGDQQGAAFIQLPGRGADGAGGGWQVMQHHVQNHGIHRGQDGGAGGPLTQYQLHILPFGDSQFLAGPLQHGFGIIQAEHSVKACRQFQKKLAITGADLQGALAIRSVRAGPGE